MHKHSNSCREHAIDATLCLPCHPASLPSQQLLLATQPASRKTKKTVRLLEEESQAQVLPRSASRKQVQQFVQIEVPGNKTHRRMLVSGGGQGREQQVIEIRVDKQNDNQCLQKLFKKIRTLEEELKSNNNYYNKLQAQHSLCKAAPKSKDPPPVSVKTKRAPKKKRQVQNQVMVPVEVLREVPFEKIYEKEVVREIEGPIRWVDKPVQVTKVVQVQEIVEQEQVVYKERIQYVEVPVERVITKEKPVEVPLEKVVYLDRNREVQEIIYVDKPIYVPVRVPVEKVVQVPFEVPYEVRREKLVPVARQVPVVMPEIMGYDIPVPRKVRIPREVIREKKVQVPYQVQVPYKVQVPIYKPVYQDVERVVEVDLGDKYKGLVQEVRKENRELKWRIEELLKNVEILKENNINRLAEIESLRLSKEPNILLGR